MARLDLDDTIVALATPATPAARAMIRVSGPDAWAIVGRGLVPEPGPPARPGGWMQPRRFELRSLGRPIPCEAAFWPVGRSYTGQAMVELHALGSPPLVDALIGQLLSEGARLAGPGEFTLRAVMAGRIDLTQAEAVLGVIDARTPAELEAALAQLAGGLRTQLKSVQDGLLAGLAHLEAVLDFVEEPDVAALERQAFRSALQTARQDLRDLVAQLSGRDRRATAPQVVLAGPPNAGKSSLFNALIGQSRALVSEVAGTTRDYLDARLDCGPLAVQLIDTAGADEPSSEPDRHAQAQRLRRIAQADLVLHCASVAAPERTMVPPGRSGAWIEVWTKADQAPPPDDGRLATSARTGQGIEALRQAIAAALTRWDADGGRRGLLASLSRDQTERAIASLDAALASLDAGTTEELIAIDLHEAIDALGTVVGEVPSEAILDQIFSRFCIGK